MKARFDTLRARLGRAATPFLLSLAALLVGAPSAAQVPERTGELTLGEGRRPAAVRPRLQESPPEHPPAAPCGACSEGSCGAGPRSIPNVYLHSGEFYTREVDLVIPGRGLDFAWTRTYRSRIGPDTPQGNGWDFAYNACVEEVGDDFLVRDGNGRSDLYVLQPGGTYACDEFFREGVLNPDDTFSLIFSDTGTWTFFELDGSPMEGKLKTIEDRNGNTMAFDYDGLGRLELILDTLGRQIQIDYNPDGQIASLTDFIGRKVIYEYYAMGDPDGDAGDLKSVRSPVVVGTPNGNDFPSGKTTVYTYSTGFANDALNHNLLTITNPNGQTWLRNEYAGQSNPAHLLFDRLVRTTRGNTGESFELTYDDVVGPNLNVIVNDPVGNVSEFAYDALSRCVRRRDFTGRANPTQWTTRSANRPMDPLRPGDPAFFESRWFYNQDSRATRIIQPKGNITEHVYERDIDPMAAPRERGNLRTKIRKPGTHVPAGDQAILVESYEYDGAFGGCCGSNFVTRHVDARGNVTEHDYDANGNRLETRHRIPSIVDVYTYNAFGQPRTHMHPENGKGWRQIDVWTYYGIADGAQNGYLRQEILDVNGEGITTTWVYDDVGNAVQVTDARGSTTTMIVNELNQVVRHISPQVQMMGGAMVQYEIDTYFDANDNVVQVDTQNYDDQGNLSTNPYITTTYDYDSLNFLVRMGEEVDPSQDVITEYEYDANRNRTVVRLGEATNGTQPANTETFVYDERNLLFQRIRAAGDPLQSTSQMDYDANGNRVVATRGLEDATPRVETWVMDGYERPVTETDPMGNVTTKQYDANGNVVYIRKDGELCDVPGSAGNVRLFEATYTYDAMDRRQRATVQHFDTSTQLPIGDGESLTLWTWTDRSQMASALDDNSNLTTVCYDTLGRRELIVDAKGNRVEMHYDANDNLTERIETEKSDGGSPDQVYSTTFVYDVLDRQTLVQDPGANEVALGYDSRDNLTHTIDALGNETISDFDGLNRMVLSTRILTDDGTGSGTPIGQIARVWSWDDSRRLISQMDDNGNTTSYEYDALGRKTKTVYADSKQELRAYDAHGNCLASFDANGTMVMNTYDLMNRIAGRSVVPGVGVSTDTSFEVWKHDGLSRIVHAEDDDSLVTKAWDSLSNVVQETQNGLSFLSTHDGMRNEMSLTYPSGKVVTSTYDSLNRIKAVSSSGAVASYDYVGPSRVERRTGGFARRTTYGYDSARRMTSVEHRLSGLPIYNRAYEWDEMYNRTKSTNLLTSAFNDSTYDSQYRLIRNVETGPSGGTLRDISFDYDGAGNRTMVTGGSFPGAYTMDATPREPADSQMNQYTSTPAAGALLYDTNGNQTSRGGAATMVYDYRNRMTSHTASGVTTSFLYDALGRNIAKVGPTPATTSNYYYHGLDVVEQRDGNGIVRETFIRGRQSSSPTDKFSHVSFNPQPEPPPHAREILARDNGTRVYFYADDLGSTAVVSDDFSVLESYEYDEAGLPTILDPLGTVLASSAIGNEWLFTGQRWDTETSFYAFYGRSMDPLTGQFLSRDPVGIWTDPVNLGNGRSYVGNNFQSMTDPTGMLSKACGGPWPGPKTVYFKYTDCGSSLIIPDALCRAMRGAGRAKRAMSTWLSYELVGYPGGWKWMIGLPFVEWFGGPNGIIPLDWMLTIHSRFQQIWDPFRKGKKIGIECEGSCDATTNAYVAWYDGNIHLCPNWSNWMGNRRGSILLHEMSHQKAGTDDHFYYPVQTDPTGINIGGVILPNPWETGVLASNADTYEGIYLKWYIR